MRSPSALARCLSAVLAGERPDRHVWSVLGEEARTEELLAAAARVMAERGPAGLQFCSIHNVKSGGCSEDCAFCAQSVRHGGVASAVMAREEEVLIRARELDEKGVAFFSLVAAGRSQNGADFDRICRLFERIRRETGLGLCASMGFLSPRRARLLVDAGVTRYHNNLETSPGFFRTVCSSHSQEEKIGTLEVAAAAGLELCSGGIVGMGEARADRIELALELARLDVRSVPLNVLMPIAGTPLEKAHPLPAGEILRTLALFRLILPESRLRLAGGRKALGDGIRRALQSSVNGLMTGDYLTTTGSDLCGDLELVRALGLEVAP